MEKVIIYLFIKYWICLPAWYVYLKRCVNLLSAVNKSSVFRYQIWPMNLFIICFHLSHIITIIARRCPYWVKYTQHVFNQQIILTFCFYQKLFPHFMWAFDTFLFFFLMNFDAVRLKYDFHPNIVIFCE